MLCCVLMRFCKVVSSKMMLFDRWLLIVVLVWKVLRRIEVGIISTIMVMEDIIFMCIVLLTWLELKKWRFPPSLNIRSLTLAELPDTRHAFRVEPSRIQNWTSWVQNLISLTFVKCKFDKKNYNNYTKDWVWILEKERFEFETRLYYFDKFKFGSII